MHSKFTSRRRHSAELKAKVLAACAEPGASVAAVAHAHDLNANLVHKWRRRRDARPVPSTPEATGSQVVAVSLPAAPVRLPAAASKVTDAAAAFVPLTGSRRRGTSPGCRSSCASRLALPSESSLRPALHWPLVCHFDASHAEVDRPQTRMDTGFTALIEGGKARHPVSSFKEPLPSSSMRLALAVQRHRLMLPSEGKAGGAKGTLQGEPGSAI